MGEVLFPRVVDPNDDTFGVQRELAYWLYSEAERAIHSGDTVLDLVEMATWYERHNEADFAIQALTRAGVERGVLPREII